MATNPWLGDGSGSNQNNAGTISISGPNPYLEEKKQATTNTPDPWRDFFLNMITGQLQKTPMTISPTTIGALEGFTKNPSVAAQYFPDLAKPLLSALRPAEDREVTQLTDLFRKAGIDAGAMQSGAFAQAGRQLIGDQADRRQQVLAQNYIPLTNQLSENVRSSIDLGLKLPEAATASLKVPGALATGIAPAGTTTHSIVGGSNASAAGASGGNQQALNDQRIRDWMEWFRS